MSAVAALGLIAFFICMIFTPIVRDVFLRANLVDHPDGERKLHLKAIPRVGGLAIILSYAVALGLIFFFAPPGITNSVQHTALLLSLLPATGLVFITGFVDDLITLEPWQKLLGQSLAASLAVSLGVRMPMPHGPAWLAMIISFVWLLACSNALNLIDGMDGLASGVALFATVATLFVAVISGNVGLAIATAPLAGCLIAFLRYNFHPASIFLGDCGSLTIGFMLGCFGLIWSQRTGTVLGMAAPLMALALPLIDVALALGRRFLRSAPLFKGDRHHIHHKVLARSITTRRAVLILYGVCGIASVLALMLSFSAAHFKWVISLVFCVLAVIGIRSLRYVEFSAALRSLSRRSMLRMIKEDIYLHELEQALAKANTMEDIWEVACTACGDLQFATLSMNLHGCDFRQDLEAGTEEMAWGMTIPLGIKGELTLTRSGKAEQPRLMMSVLDCLQASIARKDFATEVSPASRAAFSYRGAA